MKYTVFNDDRKGVLRFLAKTKRNIINGNVWNNERSVWESIPEIAFDSDYNDVVKDFSIDKKLGHAGIVVSREPFAKRDGREGVRISIQFMNHTTVDRNPDVRTRKIEFIIPTNNQ